MEGEMDIRQTAEWTLTLNEEELYQLTTGLQKVVLAEKEVAGLSTQEAAIIVKLKEKLVAEWNIHNG